MKAGEKPSYEELEARLSEAENALSALRNEEVDVVLSTGNVYMVRLRELELALLESKKNLETRVQRRTAELQAKNIFLEREIKKSKIFQDQLEKERENLLQACRQRDFLSGKLVDLLERDRREIGNTLHDQIGQVLTGISIQLEGLNDVRTGDGARMGDRLEPILWLLRDAMEQIRNISCHLRPEILERFGLLDAVADFIDEIQQHHHPLKIRFYTRGIARDFKDGQKDLAIYRIIQESVQNVIKHAHATEIFINLTKRNNGICLSIEDNGVGFDGEDISDKLYSRGTSHLGISIMKERAAKAGGVFRIESSPGRGACIQADIPLVGTDDSEARLSPHNLNLSDKKEAEWRIKPEF